jgi:hypothetical protein
VALGLRVSPTGVVTTQADRLFEPVTDLAELLAATTEALHLNDVRANYTRHGSNIDRQSRSSTRPSRRHRVGVMGRLRNTRRCHSHRGRCARPDFRDVRRRVRKRVALRERLRL